MTGYTPRNQIFYPRPGDNIKHASSEAMLSDQLRQMAFTADQAVERAGARNTQDIWDQMGELAGKVGDNTSLANQAHIDINVLGGRVGDLETIAGVAPGEPTDAALSLILGNQESQSRETLDGLYAHRLAIGIRPEDHGALGDGSHDDTDAFEAALDEATGIISRPIILTGGKTYRVTRALEATGANVAIVGQGSIPPIIEAPNDAFNTLSFKAAEPYAATQLAESMTIATNQWTVDNASGVQPGSLMQVKSSKPWYFDPRTESTDARKAELHLVERVEGSTVWTRDLANDGYNIAAETVEIEFTHPISVHLENFLIKGYLPAGSTNVIGRTGAVIEGAIEPTLYRISVEGMPYTGIRFTDSYRPVADGGHVFDANGTTTGYGVQLLGCRNGVIKNSLYAGCRRGVDASGIQVPSINTRIEDCLNLGGGAQADGTPYGWIYGGGPGAINYGFGSHGPADHTTYRGCYTSNVHIPYSLRGGNETIEQASHYGRTRGGFIQLITGENLTVRGVKLYAATEGGAKESSVFDGGSNLNGRRPDCFMRVRDTYNSSTARIYVDSVEADVQETFVKFDAGSVFTAEANFSNIRVVHATPASDTGCVHFQHDGPVIATGNRWSIGLFNGRRQGGTGGISLTQNVNIAGAKYLSYGLANSTG